ncbi:MAG: 30S ribosomal protein S20 [Planctomycetes bacterium]|nr:30S ribosomal protein S20 [Planctomycetota bacterium]
MAHSLSAKKRIRQNAKRRGRNRWRKSQIKQAVKQFDEALRAGDRAAAAERLKLVYKRLDKVAAKGTIHKNTAARKKSRLARKLASL